MASKTYVGKSCDQSRSGGAGSEGELGDLRGHAVSKHVAIQHSQDVCSLGFVLGGSIGRSDETLLLTTEGNQDNSVSKGDLLIRDDLGDLKEAACTTSVVVSSWSSLRGG